MPEVECATAERVDFELDGPVDVMVDGEIIRCRAMSLQVLPQALEVLA